MKNQAWYEGHFSGAVEKKMKKEQRQNTQKKRYGMKRDANNL